MAAAPESERPLKECRVGYGEFQQQVAFCIDDRGTMPFTPAHAAAILPFVRGPWLIPALVAGSIAPDMPYFARMLPIPVTAQSWYEPFLNATTSHSFTGAITVALPYALLLTAFWWAARRPLISVFTTLADNDPVVSGRRSARSSGLLANFGWLVASALVGIATHLVWDAVAHSARVIQHLSTAIGLLILLIVFVRHRALRQLRISPVAVVLLITGVAAWAGALHQHRNDMTSTTEHLLRAGAEAAGLAMSAILAVVITWWWMRQRFSLSRSS